MWWGALHRQPLFLGFPFRLFSRLWTACRPETVSQGQRKVGHRREQPGYIKVHKTFIFPNRAASQTQDEKQGIECFLYFVCFNYSCSCPSPLRRKKRETSTKGQDNPFFAKGPGAECSPSLFLVCSFKKGGGAQSSGSGRRISLLLLLFFNWTPRITWRRRKENKSAPRGNRPRGKK